jgi:hypothetical protein
VNIGWSRRWLRLGWAGAHTDCTNEQFVRAEIARRLMGSDEANDRKIASTPDERRRPVLVGSH